MSKGEASIGATVRRLRKAHGWSQEQLAYVAGGNVDQTMISRIENRVEYEPGVFTAARIARALGISLDALLESDPRLQHATERRAPERAGRRAIVEVPLLSELRELRKRIEQLETTGRPPERAVAQRKRKKH